MQGTRVVAFYLDANQSGKDDDVLGNNYYDVTKLQIGTSHSETVTSPNVGDEHTSAYSFTATEKGKRTSPVLRKWSCKLGHRALCSSYSIWTLHRSQFTDTDSSTYIQFHVEYTDTAGADTWGYDRGADVIPEPSSALLVSLGGLMSLFRRRR